LLIRGTSGKHKYHALIPPHAALLYYNAINIGERMNTHKNIVGADGELLNPQTVPRNTPRTHRHVDGWMVRLSLLLWIVLLLLMITFAIDSIWQTIISTVVVISTHILLVLRIVRTAKPLDAHKKKQTATPAEKIIPPHIVRLSMLPIHLPVNQDHEALIHIRFLDQWIRVGRVLQILGVISLSAVIGITWFGLPDALKSETYALYHHGVPQQVALEACRQQIVEGSRGSRHVSTYRLFHYEVETTRYEGRYDLPEKECGTLTPSAWVTILYLPESPQVHRVAAGIFRYYDPDQARKAAVLWAALAWVWIAGIGMVSFILPLLLAALIYG
jgi:hypothetical protein